MLIRGKAGDGLDNLARQSGEAVCNPVAEADDQSKDGPLRAEQDGQGEEQNESATRHHERNFYHTIHIVFLNQAGPQVSHETHG